MFFVFARNRMRIWPNRFLRKGNFRWNAGMFVWSVPTVLSEFNRHTPELADFISQIRAPGKLEKVLRDRFGKLPRVSFDYAIMEKADRVLVVEASFDWDDVGSWGAVAKYFKADEHGNAANGAVTAVDSTNNIVFDQGGATIALLGVHNLIVVRTKDALLVCHRHQAEKIKNLIGKLAARIAVARRRMMKPILGIDFGRARIGVAISDELGLLAHPLETIPSGKGAIARMAELAAQKKVDRVVVGMPKRLSGEVGPAAEEVLAFVKNCEHPFLRGGDLGRAPNDRSRTSGPAGCRQENPPDPRLCRSGRSPDDFAGLSRSATGRWRRRRIAAAPIDVRTAQADHRL